MSQSKVSVEYHYGRKSFEELLKKVIERKLANLSSQDMNQVSCNNNDGTTAICGIEQE